MISTSIDRNSKEHSRSKGTSLELILIDRNRSYTKKQGYNRTMILIGSMLYQLIKRIPLENQKTSFRHQRYMKAIHKINNVVQLKRLTVYVVTFIIHYS